MRRTGPAALLLAGALATAPTAPAAASSDDAPDGPARIERLVGEVVPVCVRAASTRCFAVAFARADGDGDDRLDRAELEALRRDTTAWFLARRAELDLREQTVVAMSLAVVNTAGLDRLIAAYDADGDGALDRDELTADVALDERPLPELVGDAEAVDWAAIRGRLGAIAGALLPTPR